MKSKREHNINRKMNLAEMVEQSEINDGVRDKQGRTLLGDGRIKNGAKQTRVKTSDRKTLYIILGVIAWVGTVALIAADIASAFGLINLRYGIFMHLGLVVASLVANKNRGSRACEICAFINVISSCVIMYFVIKEIGIWDNVEIDVIHK